MTNEESAKAKPSWLEYKRVHIIQGLIFGTLMFLYNVYALPLMANEKICPIGSHLLWDAVLWLITGLVVGYLLKFFKY